MLKFAVDAGNFLFSPLNCVTNFKVSSTLRDFSLPSRSRPELRSSGLLSSEQWQFITDDSGQIILPIFNGQESFFGFLTFIKGTVSLSRNVGNKLLLLAAEIWAAVSAVLRCGPSLQFLNQGNNWPWGRAGVVRLVDRRFKALNWPVLSLLVPADCAWTGSLPGF